MNLVKLLGEVAFGSRLRLLTDRFLQDGAKIYKSQNIDFEPRWFTTFYLLTKRSPLSITEIADELGYTQPAVTQVANVLLKNGLVKVIKHKEDTRKKMLVLSQKGIELLPKLEPIWAAFEDAIKELFKTIGYDVLLIVDKLESALDEKDMFTRVSGHVKNKQQSAAEIIEYSDKYREDFKTLNYEWLEEHFKVESEDKKILGDPENEILKNGGSIFFARVNGEVVGTAALIRHDDGRFELAKMGVTGKARGKQAGKKLAEAVIKKAKENGADRLFLETSNKLILALNLYNNLGFRQIEFGEASKYERSTIRMEMKLK
jgi:DNA-binding MarR family transcriptional regulator/N-acetylglutamate synthase-like GNAT family acetyltransferase